MFPINYHVHSNYSCDATGTVDDCCRAALDAGLSEIAFTNHFVLEKFLYERERDHGLEGRKTSIRLEEMPFYLEEVEKARKKYGLKVRFGIEADYFEGSEEALEKIFRSFPFDFVLGAVHFVDGFNVASKRGAELLFPDNNIPGLYRKYFRRLEEAAKSRLFDCLAHPDVIRKFAGFYKKIRFNDYGEYAEDSILAIAKSGTGIEINTHGYIHPVNDAYPSTDYLKLCRKHGVETVTIGADTHKAHQIALHLDKGIEKLRSVGYDKISLFESRKENKMAFLTDFD